MGVKVVDGKVMTIDQVGGPYVFHMRFGHTVVKHEMVVRITQGTEDPPTIPHKSPLRRFLSDFLTWWYYAVHGEN